MNKTFSPAKIQLLGSLIANGIDAEHLINLNAENTVWISMTMVVTYYNDAFRIEEKRGNIVVYDNHNRVGTFSKKTWDILYEFIQKTTLDTQKEVNNLL